LFIVGREVILWTVLLGEGGRVVVVGGQPMMGQREHDLLIGEIGPDVEFVHHRDAGSHIFPERFLISGPISGAAKG
jgi:hypothetical protein